MEETTRKANQSCGRESKVKQVGSNETSSRVDAHLKDFQSKLEHMSWKINGKHPSAMDELLHNTTTHLLPKSWDPPFRQKAQSAQHGIV
jgi:hypothetical protein